MLALHVALAAFVCSLPHWVALVLNHGDYSPFSVSPIVSAVTFDETHAYAPPVEHLLSTGQFAAEVDNYERRNFSAGIPFLPIGILGTLSVLSGGLTQAFIVADCIFPALLFLLFYVLAGRTIQDTSLKLLVAWTTLLVPFNLLNTLWLGDDARISPLEVTRTPQPELTFLLLILTATLTARALSEPRDLRWIAAASFASAAVVYCYYFYTVAWIGSLCLLVLLGLLWKRPAWSARAVIILAGCGALAIPYAIAVVRGKREGGQSYLLARMGAHTHSPAWIPLVAALAVLFFLWWRGATAALRRPTETVLAAVVAGALGGMNIQVLSGYETQPWHFWKRLALPVFFFLLACAGARWLEQRAASDSVGSRRVAVYAFLAILLLSTAARLSYAAYQVAPMQRASSPELSLLRWAQQHLPKAQVIGSTDPELILLVPLMTADYTYVPSGLRSLTANDEIVHRYFQLACLTGLSPSQVATAAAIPNHLHHSTELLHVLGLSYTGEPAVYRALVSDYLAFHNHCTAPSWRLDFIISASNAEADSVKLHYPQAKAIYHNARYQLLALHPQPANSGS